ncbi:hypothetical protein H5410_010469 [Solanum commersonii]|uniref:Uncharacterized protein n=1 Tax=Solanum commersonii TaxID=4109 RepID=A0A9J6ALU3_SOLCO|nr:hypothetical protein H5410_010469 [Solanum commersonii]
MVDVPRVAGTKIQLSHITTFSAEPPRSLLMHSDPPYVELLRDRIGKPCLLLNVLTFQSWKHISTEGLKVPIRVEIGQLQISLNNLMTRRACLNLKHLKEVYKQCQKQGRIAMYAILETEECQKQPITELLEAANQASHLIKSVQTQQFKGKKCIPQPQTFKEHCHLDRLERKDDEVIRQNPPTCRIALTRKKQRKSNNV